MNCNKCGTELTAGASFCNKCGAKQQPVRPVRPAPPRPQVARTPTVEAEQDTIICEGCGKQIHLGEERCKQCDTVNKAALKESSAGAAVFVISAIPAIIAVAAAVWLLSAAVREDGATNAQIIAVTTAAGLAASIAAYKILTRIC
jgi:hypothetical protein